MGNVTFILSTVLGGVVTLVGLTPVVRPVVCLFPPLLPTTFCPSRGSSSVTNQPTPSVVFATNAPSRCQEPSSSMVEISLSLFLNDLVTGVDVENPEVQETIALSIESLVNEGDFVPTANECGEPMPATRIANVTVAQATVVGNSNNNGMNLVLRNNDNRRTLSNRKNEQDRKLQASSSSGLILVLVGMVPSLAAANFLARPEARQVFNQRAQEMLSQNLATPVQVEGDAQVGQVQTCPSMQVEEVTSTFLLTSRNPTSALTANDVNNLERACALQYAQLNAQGSCNQAFLNVQSCTVAPLEQRRRQRRILDDESTPTEDHHRRLSFQSGLQVDLRSTGYSNRRPGQGSQFFDGFRRRKLVDESPATTPTRTTTTRSPTATHQHANSDELIDSHHDDSLGRPVPTTSRRLQTGGQQDLCICPIDDDGQELAVDFDNYLATINDTVPVVAIRDGEEVEEQTCEGIEFFELDLTLAVRGADASQLDTAVVVGLEQLLKEALNSLSLDNCPETFVFIDDVTLSAPPPRPAPPTTGTTTGAAPDGSTPAGVQDATAAVVAAMENQTENATTTTRSRGQQRRNPRTGLVATYAGRCSTGGAFTGTRSCSSSVFSSGFRRKERRNLRFSKNQKMPQEEQAQSSPLSSTSLKGFSIEVIAPWDDEDWSPHRYRRLEAPPSSSSTEQPRSLQADFPCYCRVGVQVGGTIDVLEYNTLLALELADYLDPDGLALERVFDSDTFPPTILASTFGPTILASTFGPSFFGSTFGPSFFGSAFTFPPSFADSSLGSSETDFPTLDGSNAGSFVSSFTLQPEPTPEPTPSPMIGTISLTDFPTLELTENPTIEMTENPTMEMTENPTMEMTENPTMEMTENPTMEMTDNPTVSNQPTIETTTGMPTIL